MKSQSTVRFAECNQIKITVISHNADQPEVARSNGCIPSGMEDGEPPYDPRPTMAEEIKTLQLIEAYLESSFDGKISHRAWHSVDSALDSGIPEIKSIAATIFLKLATHTDN